MAAQAVFFIAQKLHTLKETIMMEKILHNRYDENGNVIEQFYVEATSNETETDIYLTEDWLRKQAQHCRKGDTSKADYSGIGKTVWYRSEGHPDRQVVSMSCDHNGNSYQVVFKQPSGKDLIVVLPVK
nr:MAG TPA: hypothetical protein [Caudoviricetes sp.]